MNYIFETKISKTSYVESLKCPRFAWLHRYGTSLGLKYQEDPVRAKEGEEVGTLARTYFGDFILIDKKLNQYGMPDINSMLSQTKDCIDKGVENICEASFLYNGCYCAVDILHKVDGGYEIYEVKASTDRKVEFDDDIAYQKYVLEHCGLNIVGTYLLVLNKDYSKNGDINVKQLFKILDEKKYVEKRLATLEENIKKAKEILEMESVPPCVFSGKCGSSSDECCYKSYCYKNVPKPSVLDLYSENKKYKYYQEGVVTFEDVINSKVDINHIAKRQVETFVKNLPMHVDKLKVKEFLDTLSFPMYFLDFETFQTAIPFFDNAYPYEQIPFQYSLHIVEDEDGDVTHKEFISKKRVDPRRAVAERLVQDIPTNVCVIAYNASFEKMVIKDLAEIYTDLTDKLLAIANNLKDPLDVFKGGYIYNKAMGGSFSIKSVLPALFPNDDSTNYKKLDNIHNGTEASQTYLSFIKGEIELSDGLWQDFLRYCNLDTLGMVLVVSKLYELVK